MSDDALEYLAGELTIYELAKLSSKSVDAIVRFAMGSRRTQASSAAPQTPKRKRAPAEKKARDAKFETEILRAIESAGGSARAEQIATKVGGTPQQRAASLKRLVTRKKLKRTGKARGTTYAMR